MEGLDYAKPSSRGPMNVKRFLGTTAIAVFLLLLFSLIPFPGIAYRHHDEIDIRSGRIRRTEYIFSFRTSQTVEDSTFSKILSSSDSDAAAPAWHKVNTFEGSSRVSPHYVFHAAISQMHECEMIWALVPFTDDAKQRVVETVLMLWQVEGDYLRPIATSTR